MLERRRILPVRTLSDLYAAPEVEIAWLVEGLLPADGISLLVAPPKTGKSTLGRCLAATVADGLKQWLGRETTKGTVLHLVLEERAATVRDHYRSLGASGERIHLMVGTAPAPAERMELLRSTVQVLKPAVVMIDPLFKWARIGDANDYAMTLSALESLIELARAERTHLLLIHHARKTGGSDGNEVLGSQALHGSVDTLMSLARDGNRRTFYAHGRDGAELEKSLLSMDEHGWVQVTGTTFAADVQEVMADVLDFIGEQNEPVTGPAVRRGVGKGKEMVRNALNKLVADGDVARTGRRARRSVFCYRDRD